MIDEPRGGLEAAYDEWGAWSLRDLGRGPTPVLDSYDAGAERDALAIASELGVRVLYHPLGPAGVYMVGERGAPELLELDLAGLLELLGERLASALA